MFHNYKVVHKHLIHRLIYLGKYWHSFSNNWQRLPRTQKKWENLQHSREELAVNILILIYSVFPPNHTKPIYMHTLCCGCSVMSPWTVDRETPPSMGFSRQEYWNGLPFPPPEDLSNPGIQPRSPALQADSLLLSHLGSPNTHKTRKQFTGRIREPWALLSQPHTPTHTHSKNECQ